MINSFVQVKPDQILHLYNIIIMAEIAIIIIIIIIIIDVTVDVIYYKKI